MSSRAAAAYGQGAIEYEIRFASRSTLEISVHPDGRVEVVAPEATSETTIEDRVRARGRWIRRQQRFFEQFRPRTTLRQYVNGETHLYLGRQYRLRVAPVETAAGRRSPPTIKLRAGRIEIRSAEALSSARIAAVLEDWYRARARVKFSERLGHVFLPFERRGHAVPPIRVQRLMQRWGSLGPSGLMLLNTRLIQAPPPCIDYVITHELCHLEHRDHSRSFYSLLERLVPDWRARKARLERLLA
jgi:predicted metal-dependent hydrolase